MQTANCTIGNRMVACCDILGFKKLVKSKPLDELLKGELARFYELLIFSLTQKWKDLKDLAQFPEFRGEQKRVRIAWFSDTYLICGINDDEDSHYNVIETVAWLVSVTMDTQTPVRAGVAYGEFYDKPENELYVGKALVEAYELEQAQEWVGGALSPKAARKTPQDAMCHLKEYRVPLKTKTAASSSYPAKECEGCERFPKTETAASPTCKTLAFDWTLIEHEAGICDERIQRAKSCAREGAQSIVRKWENTSRFHVETCVSCFPKNSERKRPPTC